MKRELPMAKPVFPDKEKLLEDIGSILDSGRLMDGGFARAFETMFAEYLGLSHGISVNSCTTALEITLKYIGVEGKQVIVPTNTFIATANSVLFAGGMAVLADIKDKTYCLDPKEVQRLMSRNTKAVIVVHICGLVSPEIEDIVDICNENDIPLIEDCAHAIGATYKGRMAGTFGFAGCFSFYPTTVITTGQGGMIVTEDEGLVEYAKSVRLHGRIPGMEEIVNIGNDWFLDEIRSAIGVNQLRHLDYLLVRRREIVRHYDKLLSQTKVIW